MINLTFSADTRNRNVGGDEAGLTVLLDIERLHRDRDWWVAEAARTGTDWRSHNRACAGNAFAAACWAALNRDAGQAPAVIHHKHSSIGEPAPAEPKHHNTPTASQHPAKGGSP
jgi:hypothetical protein